MDNIPRTKGKYYNLAKSHGHLGYYEAGRITAVSEHGYPLVFRPSNKIRRSAAIAAERLLF